NKNIEKDDKRYLFEIDKLKEKKEISEEQYYLLRSGGWARRILEEKTFGDSKNVNSKTPVQILEEFKNDSSKLEIEKYEKEKKKVEEITSERDKILNQQKNIFRKIEQTSALFTWVLFILIIVLVFLVNLADFFDFHRLIILRLALTIIFSLLAIIFGFNLLDLRKKINLWISAKLKIILIT
ncbi:MAG: hypothetical protein AAB902_02515, partial [Patescibacteria group bacterium]